MKVRTAFLLVLLLELLVALVSIALDGWSPEALHTTTRFSGRLSLALFSVTFLGLQNPEKLRSWMSEQYFLMFAIAHGIHLGELLAYVSMADRPLVPTRLLGGFIAYLFIFIMPWLHYRFLGGKIAAARFNIVQNVYQYYVWFIFS